MSKFLDLNGLEYYDEKIKGFVEGAVDEKVLLA